MKMIFAIFLSLLGMTAYGYDGSVSLEYGLKVPVDKIHYQYAQVSYQKVFLNKNTVSPYFSVGLGQSWFSKASTIRFPYIFTELGFVFKTDVAAFESGVGLAFLATYIPVRVMFKLSDSIYIGPVANVNFLFTNEPYFTAGGIIRYAF